MILSIPGEPQPLQRHRSFLQKGKILHYDSQGLDKKVFQIILAREIAKTRNGDYLLKKEFYDIMIQFEMAYPRSKKCKKTPQLSTIPHSTKPDIDNLIKFVLDCGNGIAWSDDKKITSIKATKIYSNEPKTIIHIDL